MKECYFCNSSIPQDALVCPMCGSDLMEVPETEETKPQPQTEYVVDTEKKSRTADRSITFGKAWHAFANYFTYTFKKIASPVEIDNRSERNAIYGYITIIVSSLLMAGIIARVATALDDAYQFMLGISILPNLTFKLDAFEWFWKFSIFFIVYFLLINILSFVFRKSATKQPLAFNSWVTQFTTMNALFFLLLCITFVLAMIIPVGLAVPSLIVILLYCVASVTAFVSTLYSVDRDGKENKTFYQALIGTAIHVAVMFIVGYLLFQI